MYGFVFFALIVSITGAPTNDLDNRIVGGHSTSIEEHPYQASVIYMGLFMCGGSIIAPSFIVSAAHCVYDQAPTSYHVRVGSNASESGGQYFAVKEMFVHSSYDPDKMDYDLSILELHCSITFGPSALPIALAPKHYKVTPGTEVTVIGWGSLTEGGDLSTDLQEVDIPCVSNEECDKVYGGSDPITVRMICAKAEGGGKDSCQGDSGGPLVYGGYLVGVVSWGYGCARPEYPGVYARVSEFRDFIRNVTHL